MRVNVFSVAYLEKIRIFLCEKWGAEAIYGIIVRRGEAADAAG